MKVNDNDHLCFNAVYHSPHAAENKQDNSLQWGFLFRKQSAWQQRQDDVTGLQGTSYLWPWGFGVCAGLELCDCPGLLWLLPVTQQHDKVGLWVETKRSVIISTHILNVEIMTQAPPTWGPPTSWSSLEPSIHYGSVTIYYDQKDNMLFWQLCSSYTLQLPSTQKKCSR